MTLDNLTEAVGGTLYYADDDVRSREAVSVVIDSRLAEEDSVFIATKGERVDGHRFIPDVFDKGALGVICEVLPEESIGPCILVKDSFDALKKAALFYRMQLDIPIVGITGSVGKTSTKEFIASVLEQHYKVLKTAGNFNNEVGLPLTVLRIRDEHEIAVVEMGINSFGEMHRISEIAKPDVVVMTNIGECHLENLIDRDGVLKAKSEIFDFSSPDGTTIVNADDDKLITIESVHGRTPVRYGFKTGSDVFADNIKDNGLFGSQVDIHIGDRLIKALINLPGRHMIHNAMAAAAVGVYFGLDNDEIEKGIAEVKPVDGRSHLIRTDKFTIIDDCYNANPVSMKAALDLLSSVQGRKVAILGDMGELGTNELEMHSEVGRYAAKSGTDLLICIGSMSESMYISAKAEGISTEYFKNREEFLDKADDLLCPGDTILVKASHSMAFEKIVERLA